MRITVLTQLAKGLRVPPELSATLAAELQRLKWFLWHGNVFRSLQTVDDITTDLEDEDTGGQQDKDRQDKLAKAVREFGGYLAANAPAIPNYGERALPRRRDHLHLVRGIRSQPGQQTHGQKTADALEPRRRAPPTADPHPRPQRHPH